MAAHGVWKGSISFGLVTIPVSLHTAVEEHDLKFTMVDKHDLAPVGYKHVNKKTGKEVKWQDIVKGYEFKPDQYVVLKPEDFAKANVKANQILEIEDFVALDEVDATYLEKPYYIVPAAAGVKAYNLLRDALARSKKIGIGRVVLHTKYRLVAIIPMDDLLVLEILRFPHEVRSPDQLDLSKLAKSAKSATAKKTSKVSEREVAMAEQIIASMTSSWDPEKYKDTYHDDLMRVIKQKIKRGATAEIEPYNEPEKAPSSGRGKVLDLMPLLKASLERRAAKGRKPRTVAHRRATASKAVGKRA
jgi:DNA end-binding protein Ku